MFPKSLAIDLARLADHHGSGLFFIHHALIILLAVAVCQRTRTKILNFYLLTLTRRLPALAGASPAPCLS